MPSALFRGRRAYVERTCDRWFVLSAKYGLVESETVVAPYDQTLTKASEPCRPSEPLCPACPIEATCPKLIERAAGVTSA